ncbi:hypothetical protein NUSPORA_01799 [Nucleospora cyclopteri]
MANLEEEREKSEGNESEDKLFTEKHFVETLKMQTKLIVNISQKLDTLIKRLNNFDLAFGATRSEMKAAVGEESFADSVKTVVSKLKEVRMAKKYKLAYVNGLPRMKITSVKTYIANLCKVDRELIANIGYLDENMVEIVLSSQAISPFISNISKQQGIALLRGFPIILGDKQGVLRRLKRVDSEMVKNSELKMFYKELQQCVESNDDEKLVLFTIDEFIYN